MPEPSRPLTEIVEELEASLGAASDLDPEARASLEEALRKMRGALADRPDEGGLEQLIESIRGRLSDSLTRFEGSHPRLTETIGRLLDQLADLGI